VCVCKIGGEAGKEGIGNTSGIIKEENTSAEGKGSSVVLPSTTQMRRKVQGKLISKNK
jgi:hypothetical protein